MGKGEERRWALGLGVALAGKAAHLGVVGLSMGRHFVAGTMARVGVHPHLMGGMRMKE